MAHPRKVIRNTVLTRLMANTTLRSAGWTFYGSRARPVSDEDLPVGFVYTDTDRLSDSTWHGDSGTTRTQMRVVNLSVVIFGKNLDGASIDDALDDAMEEIEKEVLADTTQGGVASETEYSDADSLRDAAGHAVYGSLFAIFNVTYLYGLPVDGA